MRFDRDLMIFKGLCALSEYADAAYQTPLKPTFGLRFALAFLYSQSNGEVSAFTDFWNAVQDPQEEAYHPDRGQYQRATNARTALNGIMNAMPQWKCPGVPHRMINAARSLGNADQVFREAREEEKKRLAEWEAQERARREAQRKSRDCGYL
jgi:hypothetical protein